ncbi:MAG: 2OG-Fe(II) oxygenase [Pseudomonadota bacterium]
MTDNPSPIRKYFSTAFRWQRGRQLSGYDKMLLLQSWWPLPLDVYILRFPQGAEIAPHVDKVSFGAHYRLNIVIKRAASGGEFICAAPIYESARIKYFRPDACEHSVTRVNKGSRYVLSVGWVRHA